MQWSPRVVDGSSLRHAAHAIPLDSDWLRANPLPRPDNEADKNERGRVLAIGGCRTVPGGIRLTAEAALRAGAGKVRVATIESAALALGVAMPEIAVLALPETEDGEIASGASLEWDRHDAIIAGPAMTAREACLAVTHDLLVQPGHAAVILDAGALMVLHDLRDAVRNRPAPVILTPHIGELGALLQCDARGIAADRAGAVQQAAHDYGATVVLKGATSLVAQADESLFAYAGGGVGLATGGSGDVLAGIAAGLAARGALPLTATLWAVWLHGEAGRRCAEQMGPLGFLARELLAHLPGLMRAL